MWLVVPLAEASALELPQVDPAALRMDGHVDEAAWSGALELPDPIPFRPAADVTPVGRMRTRLLATEEALWVGFVVEDPDPSAIRAGLGRRDHRPDDTVGILLDPAGDGRRAYELRVNPLGVQLDRLDVPGEWDDDWSWDAVWRSAARRVPGGWEAEMAIPWGSLHMTGSVEAFGLVVLRRLERRAHDYAWPEVTPGTEPLLAAARIRGPQALPSRVGLELLPELTGAWSDPHVESGRWELYGVGPGLTARFAPGGGLTAVATVNPDFSQLESDSDQIDVNERFALYYDEKRPFFLEGQEWLEPAAQGMLHTRSMVAPLYGARVVAETGRLGVAALHVLDRAPAPSVTEGEGWTADQLDGHDALDTVLRGRWSLGGESYVGVFGSDKSILGTELSNRVLGVDTSIRAEKRLLIEAAALASATVFEPGEAPRWAPAAETSARFSGERLFLHAGAELAGPDFRQENGFRSLADFVGVYTEDHVRITPGLDWLPLVAVEPVDVWAYWSWDGRPTERGWDPSVWARFGNGAFLKVDGHLGEEEFGGVLLADRNLELYGSLDLGRAVRAEAAVDLGRVPIYDADRPRSGDGRGGWASLAVQPLSAFVLTVEPEVQAMDEVDGTPLFLAWTGRARAELFLSRAAWLRLVGELGGDDQGAARWRVEPVAAVEWTPGRAVYLGGSVGDDGERSWQLFAKLAWTFAV